MTFEFNDGGRSTAGFKGKAGDCVARAIAIASGRPYAEIYARLAVGNASIRVGRRTKRMGRSARNGVYVNRKWFKDYMAELGFVWTPTMTIGSGCTVHLRDGELPALGRLVVSVSKHYTAIVDNVIMDTHDPRRLDADGDPGVNMVPDTGQALRANQQRLDGGWIATPQHRCVYGFWRFQGA